MLFLLNLFYNNKLFSKNKMTFLFIEITYFLNLKRNKIEKKRLQIALYEGNYLIYNYDFNFLLKIIKNMIISKKYLYFDLENN